MLLKDLNKALGLTIKQLRVQVLKKERVEFAKQLQMPDSRIRKIEKGKARMHLDIVHKIATELGFSVGELITLAEKRRDMNL